MVRRADARKLASEVLKAVHPLAHHGTATVIAAPKEGPATMHRLAVKIAAVKISRIDRTMVLEKTGRSDED